MPTKDVERDLNTPYFARPQSEFEPQLAERTPEQIAADQALLEKLEDESGMGTLGQVGAVVARLDAQEKELKELRRSLNWTLLAVGVMAIWQLLSAFMR